MGIVSKIFDPTIKRTQIKLSTAGMPADLKTDYKESLGYSPVVYYNNHQIQLDDMKSLIINNEGLFPTITLLFKDSLNIMGDRSFPLDNVLVTVFINPRADEFEPIHCDFKITTFSIVKKEDASNLMKLEGVLNVDYLYLQKSYSIPQQTSFNALKEIAREAEMGFSTNISSTNDQMTWINPGDEGINFIKHITEMSYLSDEAFLYSFVDYYYYLNFVDIEKVFEENINDQKSIMSISMTVDKNIQSDQSVTQLILTNDKSHKDTNGYFEHYDILNQSTENALKYGHKRKIHYYDRSGNWNEKAGKFMVFDMDTITTPGADSNSIILKGLPGDEKFLKNNIKNVYTGKLDRDNMHKDATYALAQNKQNIIDAQKMIVQIHMPTPNYLLYRYQKVQMIFSQQAPTVTASQTNNRLSGHWIIIGITNKYSKGQNDQIVTLIKRELNKDGTINH